jgi:hypothetical protein
VFERILVGQRLVRSLWRCSAKAELGKVNVRISEYLGPYRRELRSDVKGRGAEEFIQCNAPISAAHDVQESSIIAYEGEPQKMR